MVSLPLKVPEPLAAGAPELPAAAGGLVGAVVEDEGDEQAASNAPTTRPVASSPCGFTTNM